jgi:hypothetical protein
MSNRIIAVFFAAAIAISIGSSTAVADVPPPTVNAYTMSPGRIAASTGTLVALVGAVIGCFALRSASRLGAIVALVAGLLGMILGGLVITTATDGVGTGNGVGGAILALALGLISIVVGALALARSRRRAGDPRQNES